MDNNEYNRTEGQQTDYSQYYNTENYDYGNTQQQYGNTYSNSQYHNPQYTNTTGLKFDGEGRPMKNMFAVQLIFAIVEILLCCINPVAMVLAIIALVFAIQANTAYVHNKEIDFKVKSKVSSILLIVGGVWAAISLVASVLLSVIFMTTADTLVQAFEQEYHGDVDAFLEDVLEGYEPYDDGYESQGYSETLGEGDVPLTEGFADFTLNGISYSVPMTYKQFEQMGYTIEEEYETTILEPDTYETILINGPDGYMIGMIRVSNDSNVVLSLDECVVDFIRLDNDAAYDKDAEPLNMTFCNGLDMSATYEDLKAFMGDPTYLYIDEEIQYENYTWYYYGKEKYQAFDVYFQDGIISEISIEQYSY